MRFANIRTLKTHTAELLQAVEAGEEVIITWTAESRAHEDQRRGPSQSDLRA